MPEIPADPVDRLLAGELSRAEERRLAQAALDDPELFDALTAAALTKAALTQPGSAGTEPGVHAARLPVRRPVGQSAALIGGLAVAAALVLAVAYWAMRRAPVPPEPTSTSVTAPGPLREAPLLLTARLDAAAQPTFRADATRASRPPRQAGTVVQVLDGAAEIDLGSLDGLTQGLALDIVRGERPVGRMTMTAVFRERARGRVDAAAGVRRGDRVEVDRATQVTALVEHATARRAAGDLTAARELVTRAAAAAGEGNVTADVLNELGVLQIEQRDLPGAERTLQSAQALATGVAEMRVTSNLGALAALRGDRVEAERLYREAASLAASSPDLAPERQAIARNLAALSR